jgi:2-C-methyl-D-erythritol 4-phosphate cytidylyltransferase
MIWAIVVAAGAGTRYGARKQFLELNGRSVASWSIAAARSVASRVVLVIPSDVHPRDLPADIDADVIVAGGETRSDSVRAGLDEVPLDASIIVIHDAARPMAGPELFDRVVAAVNTGVEGAVCGAAVTDTIKVVGKVEGQRMVVTTLDRDALIAVQTPQAFDAHALRQAHASGRNATDDAALVEVTGGTVVVVDGDARNVKITVPRDFALLSHSS